MAVSRNFSTSNKYIVYWIEMTQNSQSIVSNTSNVTVRVWVKRTNTGHATYGNGTVTCNINGTRYSSPISHTQKITSSPLKIFQRTLNIKHNSNGSKTLATSASISHSRFSSGTNSNSFTLTTIPRKSKVTSFTITDVRPTQFKINYRVDKPVNRVRYRLNGGNWITLPSNGIITGRKPGTAYRVQLEVRNTASGLTNTSNTRSITTYRLSKYTIRDFKLGDPIRVDIDRSTSNLYHDVTLRFWHDDQTYHDLTTIRNITTSTTFNLTEAQIDKILQGRVDFPYVAMNVQVVNRWGSGGQIQGTNSGDSVRGDIVNAEPSIESVRYLDANTAIQNVLNNNQMILRNKSDLRVVVENISSQKYAVLKHIAVSIGGRNIRVNISGTSISARNINVGKINKSSDQVAIVTVTDSRGFTDSKSFPIAMIDYSEPQFLQLSADRLNSYEESSNLNAEGRRVIVKSNDIDVNGIEIRYRVKENPSGIYGIWSNVVAIDGYEDGMWQRFDVDKYMADYPSDKSYIVEVQLKDKFSEWKSINLELPEGIALQQYYRDRIEFGVPIIDKISQEPYVRLDSGSNSNGDWVKFSDGTMICTHVISLIYSHSAMLKRKWVFPHRFKDEGYSVTMTDRDFAESTAARNAGSVALYSSTTQVELCKSSTELNVYTPASSQRVHVIAIGRWKPQIRNVSHSRMLENELIFTIEDILLGGEVE